MTALADVAVYHPLGRVSMSAYLPTLGVGEDQIGLYKQFYGFATVHRDPQASLGDLLVAAATALRDLPGCRDRIRYLIHARTMLVAVPYPTNPLHEARRRLRLYGATAFTVSEHACASGLLAVDLAGRLLARDGDPDALALVLAGEKAFTYQAQLIPDDAVMGEGAAAVLVSPDGNRDRVLGYVTRSIRGVTPDPWSGTPLAPEVAQRHPRALAEVVQSALEQAGVRPGDVRAVFPHHVNRLSLMRLAKRLGIGRERFHLDGIPRVGHCFCADPFLGYRCAREQGWLVPGDHYVMAAVGLGSTFSAMVVRH